MGEAHASSGLPCTDKYHFILCDRKREIFAFRPSVLAYQLSLYQHQHNRGRVSAAQVAALDPRLHLLQLIPHS